MLSWNPYFALFNPSLKNRHLNDKPPPFCGWNSFIPTPPKKWPTWQPPTLRRKKPARRSSAPTKALIKVVHRWPGWRRLPTKTMEIFGFLGTEGGVGNNVQCLGDLFYLFSFKGCKKNLWGISCIRNYFSVFRCIFAWFVFIIVWLERFRISMKHCQGKDVFQGWWICTLSLKVSRWSWTVCFIGSTRSVSTYHQCEVIIAIIPDEKDEISGPNLKHPETLLNCTMHDRVKWHPKISHMKGCNR